MHKVLFLQHSTRFCGVYQFGYSMFDALKLSSQYLFKYFEVSSAEEYTNIVKLENPDAIIYNLHAATIPWCSSQLVGPYRSIKHLAILHDSCQTLPSGFDLAIWPALTEKVNNDSEVVVGRLIKPYENRHPHSTIPIISSFGFGSAHKRFYSLAARVQDEFDNAIIRLHMPPGHHPGASSPEDGWREREEVSRAQEQIKKPGIELQVSHDFKDQNKLIDWLGQSSVNVLWYDAMPGPPGHKPGISGAIDYMLAARRPIAITDSNMFRHIRAAVPSILLEHTSLGSIIENGLKPLEPFLDRWTPSNFLKEYERILFRVLQN